MGFRIPGVTAKASKSARLQLVIEDTLNKAGVQKEASAVCGAAINLRVGQPPIN